MSQLTNQLTETLSSWSCFVIFAVLQYFGSCSSVGLPGQLVFRRGHHWSLLTLLWASAWAASFATQQSSTWGDTCQGQQAFHQPCPLSPVSPTSASLKVFLWPCLLWLPLGRRIPTVAASTLANNNKHAVGLVSCVSDKRFFESVSSALSPAVSPLGRTHPNVASFTQVAQDFHLFQHVLSSSKFRFLNHRSSPQGVSFIVTCFTSIVSCELEYNITER